MRATVRSVGSSISTCLFFCAAALLPADVGQKAQVSRGTASREMIAFVHKHYIQVWPWLLVFLALPMSLGELKPLYGGRSHKWCSGLFVTPNMIRSIGWIIGPFLPFCCWAATILLMKEEAQTDPTHNNYPTDYPSIDTHAVIALTGCGLLPWVTSVGLQFFEGEVHPDLEEVINIQKQE